MPRITQAKKRRMWHKAILAMMNEPTIAAAAKATGISQATLELWLRDPEFIEAFQMAQKTALGHGLAMVELNFGSNIRGVQDLANDKTNNAGVRLAAYGKLLDIALGLSKQRANARYIEQLEEEVRQLNSARVEEETSSEEANRQARTAQRQRNLPALGDGSIVLDADGGPAYDADAEGEEGS
jgi:hypothetical protein